jgi:hypothetical protein
MFWSFRTTHMGCLHTTAMTKFQTTRLSTTSCWVDSAGLARHIYSYAHVQTARPKLKVILQFSKGWYSSVQHLHTITCFTVPKQPLSCPTTLWIGSIIPFCKSRHKWLCRCRIDETITLRSTKEATYLLNNCTDLYNMHNICNWSLCAIYLLYNISTTNRCVQMFLVRIYTIYLLYRGWFKPKASTWIPCEPQSKPSHLRLE